MVLGVTGGIGSGKSYVCDIFKEFGIPVYNTDINSKRIVNNNHELKKELIHLLGENVYNIDGTLNKNILSEFLFKKEGYHDIINNIIHPFVTEDVKKWIGQMSINNNLLLIESAMLFQSQLCDIVDKVLVVDAPIDLRLKRAMERDKSDINRVVSRMDKQISNDVMLKYADYIIKNDGSVNVKDTVESIIISMI